MVAVPDTSPLIRTLKSPALAHAALFFLVVPGLLGLMQAATKAGVAQYLPWHLGAAFWVASSIGVWLWLFIGTRAAEIVLRPWRPPLWALLIVGAVFGSLVGRYVIYGLADALKGAFPEGAAPRTAPRLEASLSFLVYYVQGWLGVFAAWLVAGLAFERWFLAPRFRQAVSVTPGLGAPLTAASAAEPAPQQPTLDPARDAFLDKLPRRIGRNVLALEASDHYVRVHTDLGEALIFARFSDAMEVLAGLDGVRVHRSFWVRRTAVNSVRPHGKGLVLTLSNGRQIPVSQAYKEITRQAGFASAP
jgi:hypothetical protein